MKRIISLALTLVLLVACLAVPVMADEGEDISWFNFMNYGYPVGHDSYYFDLAPSGYLYLKFDNPYNNRVFYYDIIFRSDASGIVIGNNQSAFSLFELGDGLYRAYGDLKNNVTDLFFSYSSGTYFEILSFRACSSSVINSSIPVIATGTAYAQTNKQISMSYPDGPTYDYWSYSGDDDFHYNVLEGRFDVQYRFTDWRKYDFLDIQLGFIVSDITSVSAYFGNDVLPIEVTPWSNPDNSGQFFVFVSIDVSSLDRSSTNDPIIIVSGNGFKPQSNSVVIRYASGSVFIADPSPWTYWFSKLQGWLSSGFSSVTSSLSSLGTNISNLASNLSSWISNQTTDILGGFSNLEAHITGRFKVLGSWLSSYFSEQTSFLTNSISTWGQNISSTITSGVDRIVSVLSPNGSANDFNDKVQQQGSELESMAGAMNAVTRPDVSTAIPDIGGFLTVSGPVTLAAVFDPFWKNSYILRLLLGSLAVSVAFTVVYGGKK